MLQIILTTPYYTVSKRKSTGKMVKDKKKVSWNKQYKHHFLDVKCAKKLFYYWNLYNDFVYA